MLEAIRQKQEDVEIPIEHRDMASIEKDKRAPYKDSPSRRVERLAAAREEWKQEERRRETNAGTKAKK
jgi:hypothetical protein